MEEDNCNTNETEDQNLDENNKGNQISYPKQKSLSGGPEKKTLTSYSFVRNNETPREEGSNNSPPCIEDEAIKNFMSVPQPQFPPQYDCVGTNFVLKFPSPPPVFPTQMYPQHHINPMYQSTSPNNLRIAFQDMQYCIDPSPTNTGHSQIDPSPTAENLIPSFIKDDIDSKASIPLKKIEVQTKEFSGTNNEEGENEEHDFDISTLNSNPRETNQPNPKMIPKQNIQTSSTKMKGQFIPAQNFPLNSGVHQNMHTSSYEPKGMMVNIEGQPIHGPQYIIPPGANNLPSYSFGYQAAPGFVMHPMASQMPPTQNMQYYMNYQIPYPAPGYPSTFYSPAPAGEYLEQRRISMPVSNYYSNGFDQYQLNEQPMGNQMRSNSMTDTMNFGHYNWGQQFPVKQVATAPPGFVKKTQMNQGFKGGMIKTSPIPAFGSEDTFESKTKNFEMNRMNADFTNKMNLATNNNSGMMMAATGEISCHSNSTIKEEEFDSEKDCNEYVSDSSSSKASNKVQSNMNFDNHQSKNTKQYYSSLLDDEYLKSQK